MDRGRRQWSALTFRRPIELVRLVPEGNSLIEAEGMT
jgi:hypothetical protein